MGQRVEKLRKSLGSMQIFRSSLGPPQAPPCRPLRYPVGAAAISTPAPAAAAAAAPPISGRRNPLAGAICASNPSTTRRSERRASQTERRRWWRRLPFAPAPAPAPAAGAWSDRSTRRASPSLSSAPSPSVIARIAAGIRLIGGGEAAAAKAVLRDHG